jgi:shikimate kinase
LATGGGAAAREENLELLLAQAFVVYLEAPVELLWSRCGGQRGESLRPLMREGFAHFRALFQGREASYRSAHLVVDGTGEPEEIARRIIAGWRNGGWT